MKLFSKSLLLASLVWMIPSLLLADDWPQWLGPRRDGVSKEANLIATFPAQGPKVLWQRDVGPGFSGPVVQAGKMILFHRVGDREVVECLQADTGKSLWKFDYPTNFEDGFGKGNGPRSTPIIDKGRVITLGADNELHCLDLETGKKIWDRQLNQDYRVPPSFFGVGNSPIVEGNLVLVNVGGKEAGIVAFNLADGKEVWKATGDQASYSSPIVRSVGDERQAIFFTRTGVVMLDPKTGKVDFTQRWRARYEASVNAATPILVGDLLFVSTCYETGALVLRLKGRSAEEVWNGDDILSSHYNTALPVDGHLIGFEGRQEAGPSLRSIELKSGKVNWTQKRYGCGSMALADGKIFTLLESGELVLFEANPREYRELARARVFDTGPCRAQIAIADGRLFARDGRRLVCFDVKK